MRLGTYYRYLVNRKLDLPLSGNRILDIGCYDGFLLSKISAVKKFGIDTSPVRKYSGIQYIKDDFLRHDFKNKKFDRIFAFDVLEHVKEDRKFLKKLMGLLDRKGVAVLSVPSKSITVFPSFVQPYVDKRWRHTVRRGHTAQEIKAMLSAFKGVESKIIEWDCPLFRKSYLVLSLLWRIAPKLTKRILKTITDMDYDYRKDDNGFLYVLIKKKRV